MALSVRIWYLSIGSTVAAFEVLHVRDERSHAFDPHCVVDRRAHAADGAVTLQLHHAGFLRALEERFVERRVMQRKRDIHPRAIFAPYGSLIEPRGIEIMVEERGLQA